MASIIAQLTGNKIAISKNPADFYFDVNTSTYTYSLFQGLTSMSIDKDKVNIVSAPSQYAQYIEINPIIGTKSIPAKNFVYESSNTNVATISGNFLYYKTNGTAFVTVSGLSILDTAVTKNTTNFAFASGTNGTLSIVSYLSAAPQTTRLDSTTAVDLRIFNKSATTSKNIFTTQNHTLSSYVRNTNCWAYDLDLTCISPWNSSTGWPGGTTGAGTLITPRHIIFAAHFELPVGCNIRFITNNNTIVQRRVIAKKRHPSYSILYPDLTIGVLDSDVPSSISFCKILPDNWSNYLPTDIDGIPCLVLDQEEKALTADGWSSVNNGAGIIQLKRPSDTKRLQFYEELIVGDSGNPCFFIINNQLVILTVWTSGPSGAGTSISAEKAVLNQMINELDTSVGINTGYTLTEVNLSNFKNFN
jgi:hypothetical protein